MAAWTQHPNVNDALTDRQREVLGLIAAGRTNPEIAEALGVSLAGAKWHVSEVISRLGVDTREEAAEVWRAEHSLPRRFFLRIHALAGLGVFKTVAVGVAALSVAGASLGAGAVIHSLGKTDQPEATADARLAEFPNAIYTRAEALDVGRRLAANVIAHDSKMSGVTFESRAFEGSDLVPAGEQFFEDATSADFGLPGNAADFPAGRNLWLVAFTASGFDTLSGSAVLAIKVAFEDGQATLIDSWMDAPDLPVPVEAHPALPSEVAGTFSGAGRTFEILVGDSGTGWQSALRVDEGEISWTGFGGTSASPGTGPNANEDMFGVLSFASPAGFSTIYGAVSSPVVRVEVLTEDGRTATVLPQAPPPGTTFPYNVFGTAFSGNSWIQEARAYDATGAEVGFYTSAGHPTNP